MKCARCVTMGGRAVTAVPTDMGQSPEDRWSRRGSQTGHQSSPQTFRAVYRPSGHLADSVNVRQTRGRVAGMRAGEQKIKDQGSGNRKRRKPSRRQEHQALRSPTPTPTPAQFRIRARFRSRSDPSCDPEDEQNEPELPVKRRKIRGKGEILMQMVRKKGLEPLRRSTRT